MADRIPLGFAPRANSGAGAQLFGWNNIPGLAKAFATNIATEQERWFPWAVVGFGAGIAIYFGLSNEPPPAAAAVAAGAGLACVAARRSIASALNNFLFLLAAMSLFGFADAQLRTRIVAAPTLATDLGAVRVTGRIEDVEIRAPDRA